MQTTGICNANNPRFFLHKSWSKLGLAKAEILRRLQGALLAMGSRLPKKGRRREGSGQGAIVPVLRILGSPYLSGRFPDSGLSQLPPSTKASFGLLFWKNVVSSGSRMRNLFLFVFLCFFETEPYYVSQSGLELIVLWSQPSECWDYSWASLWASS